MVKSTLNDKFKVLTTNDDDFLETRALLQDYDVSIDENTEKIADLNNPLPVYSETVKGLKLQESSFTLNPVSLLFFELIGSLDTGVITISNPLPSFDIEAQVTSDEYTTITNNKVETITISGTTETPLDVSIDTVGLNNSKNTGNVQANPVSTNTGVITWSDLGVVLDNNIVASAQSFTITINLNIDNEPVLGQQQGFILVESLRDVTFSIDFLADREFLDLQQNDDLFDVEITSNGQGSILLQDSFVSSHDFTGDVEQTGARTITINGDCLGDIQINT